MITEQQADELLSVLSRIAASLERMSSVVDHDENEFNVYVRGEVNLDDDDEDDEDEDDEDDDEESDEEHEYEEEETY